MSKVINLYGEPSSGKSTLATEIFFNIKRLGYSTEIVREIIKEWAWTGRKISAFDQFYITATQAQLESLLYGKVDFIITDSPMLMGSFYEKYYHKDSIALPACLKLIQRAESLGVTFHNFVLKRNKPYETEGRYETEEQASQIGEFIRQQLKVLGIQYEYVELPDEIKAANIIARVI